MNQNIWNILRPFHSPVTRALRKRLGRNYFDHPEMELPPAYEAVQLEAERRLHAYLHVTASEIEQIVIVGANDGSEIPRLRHSYPNSRFLCFEPSPRWYDKLNETFQDSAFVESRRLALSDTVGTAKFHELPLAGNGSLLPPDIEQWADFTESSERWIESFEVPVSTLDKETEHLAKVDLLWVDVQGAEDGVLRGGTRALEKTKSVLLEIALSDSPYQGAKLFPALDSALHAFGFSCVALGVDGRNYTGNALWVRDITKRTPPRAGQ